MKVTDEERRLAIEHQDTLRDLQAVLATVSGRNFIKYLFKHLEVMALPEIGLEGMLLYDRLGSLRHGRTIFNLVSQANGQLASQLLSEVEKERQDELMAENSLKP